MPESRPALFQPLKVGTMQLQHRVVLSSALRYRCNINHVPLPIVREYYSQRASAPGTLLLGEGTVIASEAGGFDYTPGIWSEDQIAAWKEARGPSNPMGSADIFIGY